MDDSTIPAPVPEAAWTLWSHRIVSIPLLLLTTAVAIPLALPALLLALVFDRVTGRDHPASRATLLVLLALGTESLGVVGGLALWLVKILTFRGELWFFHANFKLQRLWAQAIYHGVERIFDLKTVVEGQEAVPPSGPVLVFIRHTSVADTLLPVVFIGVPFARHLRFVLKSQLLWDPCLNIVGPRLGNAFVRRGSEQPEAEIRRVKSLLHHLRPNEGVLIYPEGTRFTKKKRDAALARLKEHGHPGLADRAEALKHVLPPRLGGPLALLESNPGADVVFCAHRGFDGIRQIKDMWSGALVGMTVRVKLWRVPFEAIPTEREALVDWLYTEWEAVDAWVEANREP